MTVHDRRETAPVGRRSARHQLRTHFRRSMRLVALSAAIPGTGLIRTRARMAGWAIFLAFLLAIAVGVALIVSQGAKDVGLYVLSHPDVLQGLGVLLAVGGLFWCASIIATAVAARPDRLDRTRTRVLAVFTTLLVGLVGAGTYKGAEAALITTDTIRGVFSAEGLRPGEGAKVVNEPDVDPWRDTPRVNLLLMGSDAGIGRTGTRPDSMIVASIDTRTGRTALISVPRNFEWAPLPAGSPLRERWPGGFYGGTHDQPDCPRKAADAADPCAINAIWTEVDQFREANPDAYADEVVPGRSETRDVVGEVLGLKIDHLVVIDLQGFMDLVNAMGGVEVNVKLGGFDGKTPLPYGQKFADGSYAHYFDDLGPQQLNGYQALWYARTRAADNDDHRQRRQRCVVQAVVDQVDPALMLAKYASIAHILKENVYTDIPGANLPAFAELVERVQKAKITSLGFTDKNGFPYSSNPDYELVRELVQKAIDPPTKKSKPKPAVTTPTEATIPTPSTTETEPADVDKCA
ncbi:LCP family protein [Intrasporangium calvum]|uniref:LCP family protein n=1 Tax=Intrasporangium calvum TaxID=53358 RepID=UPI000DF642EE|nr:LCP family protein [Intrasporangium calvum]AXG12135.1 LytR family transcriptional regulator [Intrasporangium calvum]